MSKLKNVFIIGFASGVLLLIVVAVVLLLTLGKEIPLLGAWHNEELNQVLHFHEDGTVVIRTSTGDYETTYLFNQSQSKGVIISDDKSILFKLERDSLVLALDGAETTFARGDT